MSIVLPESSQEMETLLSDILHDETQKYVLNLHGIRGAPTNNLNHQKPWNNNKTKPNDLSLRPGSIGNKTVWQGAASVHESDNTSIEAVWTASGQVQ